MSERPVIIIGAGLGGLCLAQGLRKLGVPFHVYERDSAFDARPQGYRLRVRQDGLDALERLCPPETYDLFDKTCAINQPIGYVIDAVSGEKRESVAQLFAKAAPSSGAKPPERSLPMDRATMRKVLFTGIESFVTWGKAAAAYREGPDGVTVVFSDGSTADGALLVAADGSSSSIGRQLLGDAIRHYDMGIRSYYGKTLVTTQVDKEVGEALSHGFHVILENHGAPSGRWLVVERTEFQPDTPLPGADYIYWMIGGTEEEFGLPENRSVPVTNGQEARDLLVASTQTWHPSIAALLAHADVSQITGARLRTADPRGLAPWQTQGRVTGLGESIHLISAAGAFGGVATILDAEHLAGLIGEAWKARNGPSWEIEKLQLQQYEEQMRERGSTFVAGTYHRATGLYRMRPIAFESEQIAAAA